MNRILSKNQYLKMGNFYVVKIVYGKICHLMLY
jgi:hypothetical protein